jgi:Family of unknown function (DUF5989)
MKKCGTITANAASPRRRSSETTRSLAAGGAPLMVATAARTPAGTEVAMTKTSSRASAVPLLPIFDLALAAHLLLSQSGVQPAAPTEVEMKRFLLPIGIVIVILVGLALLTEGSAIAPFLYRNF